MFPTIKIVINDFVVHVGKDVKIWSDFDLKNQNLTKLHTVEALNYSN